KQRRAYDALQRARKAAKDAANRDQEIQAAKDAAERGKAVEADLAVQKKVADAERLARSAVRAPGLTITCPGMTITCRPTMLADAVARQTALRAIERVIWYVTQHAEDAVQAARVA